MKNQELDTTIPIALALPNISEPINCCNCAETEIIRSLLNVSHHPGKDERDQNKQKLSQILR
jgi:hypothetical protein